MVISKASQRAKDLCAQINQDIFLHEIKIIIDKLYKHDISIIVAPNTRESAVAWDKTTGTASYIRLQPQTDVKLVWDLIHEYGHILDGYNINMENMSPQDLFERERRAWDYGKRELAEYPILFESINDYVSYAEECLNTYRKMIRAKYGIEIQ